MLRLWGTKVEIVRSGVVLPRLKGPRKRPRSKAYKAFMGVLGLVWALR